MDLSRFNQRSKYEWRIEPHSKMRVPGIIYASEQLILEMDDKVYEQVCNVATLPGIVKASYAMPDAHWGYGFPIGGVAAFDAKEDGVVSAGGVGFDISCGVRTLLTGLTVNEIRSVQEKLADVLFKTIPAGLGSTGRIRLSSKEMNKMLIGGAQWAVAQGYGESRDLLHTEEAGCMQGAKPSEVSDFAKRRQRDEMGTLGSGNHYLEVQQITEIYDPQTAAKFGLKINEVVVSIHCGSRGLGHQIGTDFLRDMVIAASDYGIHLPDRELACAPIKSALGESYLGAMRAGINCALANRQIITHLTREAFASLFPNQQLDLLYDVSHNTCKLETHIVDGIKRKLYVHRKGATRAYGPGNPEIPEALRAVGQPVIIGGTMGTASYILVGSEQGEQQSFSSACHGAGRSMSRHAATKLWQGRKVVDDLRQRDILIRSPSMRGVAEEAPGAYKNVQAVVDAASHAGLANTVARLEPLVCIKG